MGNAQNKRFRTRTRARFLVSLQLILMAGRIFSWGGNEHIVSPNPLKPPSIVSVDSILQDKPDTSPAVQGTPDAAQSRTMNVASQVIEPSGTSTWASTSTYPGDDTADDLFVRHPKYFFKDGNIAFVVDNTLYCVHRYFFSRDSIYFSTRFTQLDIHDHEALSTIISLGDIEPKDFDAFLSVLYPENFEEKDLCYEEWKSVLHLSTRWSFSSIRKLALNSIEPPTPHDRLLLARTYSVDDWVVPALSGLCERTTPLILSEARQMSIEDVILVSTVREHIRGREVQVDAAEIPFRVEAEQRIALGHRSPPPSSRESEGDIPMAGAWYSGSCPEKAEAETRAKAQEATTLRLELKVKERGEAEEKTRQEAEKARLEAEEKLRNDVEEWVRLEAEKARKDAEEKALLEAEKERKDEEEKARLEAEKERKDEEKARLEVEEKKRKDAEDKKRVKKEKRAAALAAKKREADAKAQADAIAKAAEAESKRQAEAEAEKTKREAEAKAAEDKLEAEAKAVEARIKAKEDADDKAKAKEADCEAEAKWVDDAKAIADAAHAEAKAAAAKAEQEAATRAATAEAEAAAAEQAKKEKERQRVERLKELELQRVKAAEEQVARQRAVDKARQAARLASNSPASSPISSQSSGGGWFSKVSQAVAASGQTDEPRSPWGPATGSSDLFSRFQIRPIPSPYAEPGPRNSSAMRQSTPNLFPDALSPPSATSGSATRSSVESENPKI